MNRRFLMSAMCLCTSLGLAFAAANARADLILDDFTVAGTGVDPGADIPANRDLTGSISVNTSGSGFLVHTGNTDGDAFYSFAPFTPSMVGISSISLDVSTLSGTGPSVTLLLIGTDSAVHQAGPYTFPSAGTYNVPFNLFDNGAITDLAFLDIILGGTDVADNIELDSVYFPQVPEPTSLVTALIGGIGFFGYCRRRRRRSAC